MDLLPVIHFFVILPAKHFRFSSKRRLQSIIRTDNMSAIDSLLRASPRGKIEMMKSNPGIVEESLDPEDWEAMRILGHRMVDDMLDHLKTIRQQPAWSHAPEQVKAHFREPLPLNPQPAGDVYQEFLDYVLPYPVGNTHPRFWGWVFGTGTLTGAFAEFLAAVMNTNSGDLDHHSANHVEKQVLDWLKELLGYPAEASGLLTSGCSAANLIGLAVARNAKAGFDVRKRGLDAAPNKLILYTSEQIHSSIQKSVELLGLGNDAIRYLETDDNFRMDIEALRTAISHDLEKGYQPFCVVGAAGSTNTGSTDDLNALADVCQEHNLWLHIDAAFGAWAVLAPEVRDQVVGMERADSLAFDLHKWMYMPYEIGCVLVRNEQIHRQTFSLTPAYLASVGDGRGLTGGDLPWLTDLGYQLSRQFRALKAWMSFKEHGVNKYGRLIRQNIEQARYLEELVTSAEDLELAAPVPLNVVCFRYAPMGLGDAALNTLNKEILVELQERGIAVPSGTTLRGRYVLRVGITNHRSRREDFEVLVQEVIRIGRQLATEIL
jgi:aromatic-L-amino-acid decarboxylase